MSTETIFALATAPGKSGVAIIRISGESALPALMELTGKQDWQPNTARFTSFYSRSGAVMDRGLALFFHAPHSFTGEDVVELHLHGSLAVIREMLERLGDVSGLRPAEPGEFTRRAFLNGKMDLIEAEGLADFIDAETSEQKTQALRQMQGELSHSYESLRGQIVHCLALLEAYIDFPDEDIPDSVLEDLKKRIDDLKITIAVAIKDHRRGERVREGIRIVILGAPNAGKSSLLNALAGREAAIVSHRAGTTRDVIEVHMDIAGYPVILTDTAGIRESADEIEEEGVRRALDRAGEADIKLLLLDGTADKFDNKILDLSDNQTIIIISKSDILPFGHNILSINQKPIHISTKTGEGIDGLLKTLEGRIVNDFSGAHAPLITRARHRSLLSEALQELEHWHPSDALEIGCEKLRRAGLCIGKITGKIAVDDVLDVVFKQFCIGK